jgi:hypothetical protein
VDGTARRLALGSLVELAALLEELTPAQALTYGVPAHETARVVTQDALRRLHESARSFGESTDGVPVIARDREHFQSEPRPKTDSGGAGRGRKPGRRLRTAGSGRQTGLEGAGALRPGRFMLPIRWSSSPLAFRVDGAWSVDFNTGPDGYNFYLKDLVAQVRLVRGGAALPFGGLNDTGLDWWADGSQNDLASEPPGYPGQDASHGRDVTHDDDADGHAGFAFTKLDASGNPLPASATSWSCVRDEVTGLVWEAKTDDGGLHHRDWTYTWYDPNPATNGGSVGTADPGGGGSDNCLDPARCDTHKYVADVNAAGLCGAADWRLPSRVELHSLADYSRQAPALDTGYFPDAWPTSQWFWSSSPVAHLADHAWGVHFFYGGDGAWERVGANSVRLVRVGSTGLDDHGPTIRTATPLGLGAAVSGGLQFAGDEDYFRLETTEAGLLRVYTTGGTDTAGTLLDALGVERASAGSAGAGANFALTFAVTPGTYYLRVEGGSPATTGAYLLASELLPGVRRADFDADGKSDLLWRHGVTGDNAIWLMEGTGVKASPLITTVPDLGRTLVGTGDFDGDGKSDLLWRHSPSGLNAVWLMDGATVRAGPLITAVPDLGWAIAGTRDFDGDGKADLVWRHSPSGLNAIWLMDGATVKAGPLVTAVPDLGWQIAAVADYDGDGKADLAWRHTVTGDNAVWLMDGASVKAGPLITAVPDLGWAIVQ